MSIFHEAIYLVGALALCVSLYFNLMQIRIIRLANTQISMQAKSRALKPKSNTSKLFHMANQLETAIKGLATSNYWTQDHQQCPSLYRTKLRNELGQVRSLLHALRHAEVERTKCEVSDEELSNKSDAMFENNILDLSSLQKALIEFANFHHCTLSISISEQCIMAIPNNTFCKVLKELIVNAVVHNDEGTNVLVYGGVCDNNLVVNVLDNGKGMSVAQLNAIWFKVDNACALHRRSADTYVFTDLPAAICTIKSFGGHVEVNTALDYGTNVRVFVPLNDTNSKNDNTHEVKDKVKLEDKNNNAENHVKDKNMGPYTDLSTDEVFDRQQSSSPTVLVINFSSIQLLNNKDTSILPHHQQCYVETIDEAIVMLSRKNIKLVLCDIDVEYDKVLEISSFMASSPKMRDIPVVLLAFAIPQDFRIKLLRAGVTNFLEKPVRIEEVMAISRTCIDEAKAAENNVEEALATYTIEKAALTSNKTDSDFAGKFQNIVEKHFVDQTFNRGRCASLLFMSEQTLHRRIRENFDSNFRTYLQKHRMVTAREMLLNGESVTYASLNVGIPSLSNFTRNFRVHFGYPPSKLSRRGL